MGIDEPYGFIDVYLPEADATRRRRRVRRLRVAVAALVLASPWLATIPGAVFPSFAHEACNERLHREVPLSELTSGLRIERSWWPPGWRCETTDGAHSFLLPPWLGS